MVFGAVKRFFGQSDRTSAPTDNQAIQGELPASIRAEMMRFDQMIPGLGKKALAYVTSATNPAILETIRKECGSANYGGTAWYTSDAAKEEPYLRGRFFAKGDYPAPEIFIRYLEILKAKNRDYFTYGAKPEQTPPLVALYIATLKSGLSFANYTDKMTWEEVWQSHITPARIFHSVKQISGGLVDFFGLMLNGKHQHLSTLESQLMHHPEMVDFLQKYPRALETALERLTPDTRAALAKLMQKQGWLLSDDFQGIVQQILAGKPTDVDRSTLISLLSTCDADALASVIENTFAVAGIETRLALVDIITRNGAPALMDILRARATREKAAKVRAAIEVALDGARIRDADAVEVNEDGADASHYRAIDGTVVEIPTYEIPIAEDLPIWPPEFRAEFDKHIDWINQDRAARLASNRKIEEYERTSLQPITDAERAATFSLIAEIKPLPQNMRALVHTIHYSAPGGSSWLARAFERLPDGLKIRAACLWIPGASVNAVTSENFYESKNDFSPRKYLRAVLTEKNIDLRALAAVYPAQYLGAKLTTLPAAIVWPYIAENLSNIDAALGLAPAPLPDLNRHAAIICLKLLPKLPERYFRTLLDLGVTARDPERSDCRALLHGALQLEEKLISLLDDSRADVRIETAIWLADARLSGANAALLKRLAKEKSDVVRTTLIQTLQRLGADLSSIIGPEALLKESEAGLKAGKNKIPDWFNANALLSAHFQNGTPVPQSVMVWWCALATKMKDPAATARFGLYLDQLMPADAQALSNQILDSWIKYDTHSATQEEAEHYAATKAQERYATHRRWSPSYTLEKAFADLKREKLGEMPNSGSDSKGLLALACRADPLMAAQKVQKFLKKHGRRSNQAMALLDVLSGIAAPSALQVVIAASVRLKQKSTQKYATDLVTRFAEDRGWTVEELADRTIPTAGFDDDGILDLLCGEEEKTYAAYLDGLTIRLRNPEGRDISVLPTGDDDATTQSRKSYSDAKKELKQIIELQSARLKEAMCYARSWPTLDWVNFFHDHPVMRRLIEKFVWEGLTDTGTSAGLFRLAPGGDFVGLNSVAVSLSDFTHIRLAHGALLDAPVTQTWEAYIKNSDMVSLMPQFGGVRVPLTEAGKDQDEITDRKGWMTDSFTLRGIATKLGYAKIASDGGGCNEYEKIFPALGLVSQISYSGSYAVEENIPAAVIALRFRKQGGSYGQTVTMGQVPAVLRAECHADYHAMAAKAAYDPDWEKKSPW